MLDSEPCGGTSFLAHYGFSLAAVLFRASPHPCTGAAPSPIPRTAPTLICTSAGTPIPCTRGGYAVAAAATAVASRTASRDSSPMLHLVPNAPPRPRAPPFTSTATTSPCALRMAFPQPLFRSTDPLRHPRSLMGLGGGARRHEIERNFANFLNIAYGWNGVHETVPKARSLVSRPELFEIVTWPVHAVPFENQEVFALPATTVQYAQCWRCPCHVRCAVERAVVSGAGG